ncbi:MAG: cytochrome c [Acidimicrobiia bacterium]|nr:cytochrome c [Acidimicrobiia bacterium]
MGRFLAGVAVLSVVLAGSIGHAQMKVANLDDYRKAMQAIGGAVGGANKALQGGMMADAKKALAAAKPNLMGVEAFFTARSKPELVAMAKTAIEKVDALDKALGGTDSAAAMAAFKEVGATCQACHAKARDQDPNTKAYSFKPGIL